MTQIDLESALRAAGLKPGDEVLVHTRLSAIGWVEDGPAAVVDALLNVVTPQGTVLFPALTGSAEDSLANPPVADLGQPPATWVGKVPAAATARRDSLRSIHPTHSVVAIGGRAALYTDGHESCETPCGVGSPYHRLALEGGRILLLGCSQANNTSLHMVEELAGVPYHLLEGIALAKVIDRSGREHVVPTRLHAWNAPRNFLRIDDVLDVAKAQTRPQIGDAECRLIDAGQLMELSVPLLKEDSNFLLA